MLKQKLNANQLTIGSWVTIGHPSIIEILSNAGFEWLVIDLEHTSIDLSMAQILITTIQSCNMKALVRISKNEEVIIKRVLDMGSDGIIVPMVNTQDDAIRAVEYTRYPPKGKRGVGLFRAQNYGVSFNEYKQFVEEEIIVIAQIEHKDAIANINEIISVDGIDGTIIGPYDLSASMGYPGEYNRQDVIKAIQAVKEACSKQKVPYGFHVIESDPSRLQLKIDEGATFLAYSTDFFFLGDTARDGMRILLENQRITQ